MAMPKTFKEKVSESLFVFGIASVRCRMLTHFSA